MRFAVYDTNGRSRDVTCDIDADLFRSLLSSFKTHCVIEKSAYEWNHFVNWMRQRGFDIKNCGMEESIRVDM